MCISFSALRIVALFTLPREESKYRNDQNLGKKKKTNSTNGRKLSWTFSKNCKTNSTKTFTRTRVNICFDLRKKIKTNSSCSSHINISLCVLMKSDGKAVKKNNNFTAAHFFYFLSLTLSITSREAARWEACEPNDVLGRHCKHTESQRAVLCVICLDLSGPGPTGAGRGGAG